MNKIPTLYAKWCVIFGDELPRRQGFDRLIGHYQAPCRHYHDITHVYECFLYFDDIQDKPLSHPHQHDLDYLLDIDLAILASDEWRFCEYQHQICQEYTWVDEPTYHTKRQSVLKRFYDKDRIYLSDYFIKG